MRIRSASEQLADHLKERIRSREWEDAIPGESWMVRNLQVGRNTVRAALARLEQEGLVISEGRGRRRRIVNGREDDTVRKIRVRIFLYERDDAGSIDASSLMAELLDAGMDAAFTAKSLKELGMDAGRVARYVKQNPADAWIVRAASREVVEWFAGQESPTLAMYGRQNGLSVAAAFPIMIPGLTAAVRHLVRLGHRRIVMLAREERRKPKPSLPEQTFLEELEAAGIRTGEYNLPQWEESRQGLTRLLDGLFRVSPPTALIFQEARLFLAARIHLADRGILTPRDVSLVVADHDPSFAWCDPVPSQIHWDYRVVVRRVVGWAKNVAYGKKDLRKSGTEATFSPGGTTGPAPGR